MTDPTASPTRLVRTADDATTYEYVTLRCVPRIDRDEQINVGVVVYCERAGYLGCATHVDEERLRALDPGVDVDAVREALRAVEAVCDGLPTAGLAAAATLGVRFGHLSAPRSTVVQPGPVHGGVASTALPDGPAILAHLLRAQVLVQGSAR